MAQSAKLKLIGIDEVVIGNDQDILATTLGSCVAIALWDPKKKIGGLNHYLLPDDMRRGGFKEETLGHRIIDELIREMLNQGTELRHLKAVVVGGSESSFDHYQVGSKNLSIAKTMLKAYGISPVTVSGGGYYSRKVQFYVGEGKIVVHKLALNQKLRESEEVIMMGGNR